jgi:hypothetical protein
MRPYLWAVLLLVACGSAERQPHTRATISVLDAHYPVSQITREGDWAYFTVVYSDTASHRYFASCSRAAYGGMEWPTARQRDPRIAFEPADSVLFQALCG